MRLFTLLASLLSFTSATIKNCDPASVFQITTLSLTPEQPAAGDLVKLSLVFNNPGAPITDGTVATTVSYNGLPFSSSETLCKNTECPIVTGSNDRSTQNEWPSISGTVSSKIVWKGVNDESLLCIQMKVVSANAIAVYKGLRGEYNTTEVENGEDIKDIIRYRKNVQY